MIQTHYHLAVAAAARPAGQAGTRDGSSRRRCTTSGTAAASGGETKQTGRDDEGSRVCGPGWRARRGAESRECRGEATHDGGQDVSHDVTGKGNQKQSRAGAGRLPCNHTCLGRRPGPKQCAAWQALQVLCRGAYRAVS